MHPSLAADELNRLISLVRTRFCGRSKFSGKLLIAFGSSASRAAGFGSVAMPPRQPN
jgi:hypothetical protein